MSNIRTFFSGGSSFNGRFVKNPNLLARVSANRNNIQLKTSSGFATAVSHDSNMEGAYITAVVDTYRTICDITGAGALGWILSAHPEGGSTGTVRLRVTVDGTEYTLQNTANNLSTVYGAFFTAAPAVANEALTTETMPAQYNSYGFQSSANSSLPITNKAFLLPAWETMSISGITILMFETSLKVECWMSTVHATSYYDRACVAYALF